MKGLLKNSFLIALLAVAGFVVSCSDDEDPIGGGKKAPELTIEAISADSIYLSTESVGLKITVTAEAGINKVDISGFATEQVFLKTSGTTENSFDTTVYFTLDKTAAGAKTITVEVVDDAGGVVSADYDFVVSGLSIFKTVLIGGQSNATLGSFYDATMDSVYTASNAFAVANQASIDFVFWYGGTSQYAIGSTTNDLAVTAFNTVGIKLVNLATRNETKFKLIADADRVSTFDKVMTKASLSAMAGEVGFTPTYVPDLKVNDVFAIQLDSDRGSKYGIVKVIETSGTGPSDRAITIEVKIEK